MGNGTHPLMAVVDHLEWMKAAMQPGRLMTLYVTSVWIPEYNVQCDSSCLCSFYSRSRSRGQIQGGGHGGQMTPPFRLKRMASFRKIEPFSLVKLQPFQTVSSYCSIKLTSKVQNLVEMEHFADKKQLIASRLQQLGGVVNQFVGVSKILCVHIVL